MMLKEVLVMLAVLMPLLQASGETVNVNLNFGDNTGGTGPGTAFKSLDPAVAAALLKQAEGGRLDPATGTWQSQLDILDMSDTGRSVVIALMQEQIKGMQKQFKDMENKHADLENKVKNLTLDLCLTKKTCCNETLTCPSGYERFCEKHDMCYKFSTEIKFYADAKSACHAASGGLLVMPKDQATNDFLGKQIEARYPTLKQVWIGLTDEVTEGTWVWEDGTTLGSWNNWAQGSPKSYLGTHFNWAVLGHTNFKGVYKWSDLTRFTQVNYVCEVKATAAAP